MDFRRIDLFSSTFSFNIGGSQIQKGTIAGSLLSIGVIILTLSYSIYLFQLFFNNQIEPTYRAQNIITNQTQPLDITNIYSIKIHHLYPTSQDLQYTIIRASATYSNGTNTHQVDIQIKNCEDKNLDSFSCLDQIQFYDEYSKANIQNQNYNYKLTDLYFAIFSCNEYNQTNINCASQEEIDEVMQTSVIVVKMQVSYYDIYQKKVNQSFQTFSILSSQSQLKASQIKQQIQKTTIKDGLFIQNESIFSMPYDYQIDNQNLDREFAKEQFNLGVYNIICVNTDQMYYEITIQYPTIPQVLTQVNSVFNLLIFLGFFMKYISQSSLKEELLMVLTKNVYQDFYLQIFKLDNSQKPISQVSQLTNLSINPESQIKEKCKLDDQKRKEQYELKNFFDESNQEQTKDQVIENQINFEPTKEKCTVHAQQKFLSFVQKNVFETQNNQEEKKLQNQNVGPKLIQCNQIKQKEVEIFQVYSKDSPQEKNSCQISICINEKNQLKQQENQLKQQENQVEILDQEKPINQKFYDAIIKKIKFVFRLLGKNKYLQCKRQEIEHKNLIEKQLMKDMDILQFYKDIIFLKKAIMMLLTQDQLATLKFIGCSFNLLNKKQITTDIDLNQLSHCEQQFAVFNSDDLQEQNAQKFLERCSNQNNMNEIDQRILNSIFYSKNVLIEAK
ncbi:hypothetical protein ABPG72_006565 [Tetrahymena utriculariae]